MTRQPPSLLVRKIRKDDQGFSLVEVLTVLAIMAVLTGLSISAIPGMRSSYDRKTAVDLVMTTIEQARVAALQSGGNTYVVFALAKDSGLSPDAMIVVGDQPIGSTATGLVLYTHWIRMPLGVRFHYLTNTLVASSVPTAVNTTSLPPLNGNPNFTGFTFNSTGTVSYPATGGLDVALFEGIRSSHMAETAVGPSAKATMSLSTSGLYEVIRLSRYSGRSWMDVSNLLQL